jgi:hypothetical protein
MRVDIVDNVDNFLAFHSRSTNHILTQSLHQISRQYKNSLSTLSTLAILIRPCMVFVWTIR